MTQDDLATVDAGFRTNGAEYLRELTRKTPSLLAELLAYMRGPSDAFQSPVGPVRFVIRQQPGSDNRT